MPASRSLEFADRLNSRSYTGRAAGVAGQVVVPTAVQAALIITSKVLPAAIKTSVWTRGAGRVPAPDTKGPGMGLPSSAINVKPPTVAVAPAPVKPDVCDPTIAGTCMCNPAFTRRAKTVPATVPVAVPCETGNCEATAFVLLNATPL